PEGCIMADRGTNMIGTECSRLLTSNGPAERDGSPDPQGPDPDATGSWHSHSACRLRSGPEPINHVGAASVADSSGFSPRAAIATGSPPCSTSEAEPAVRIRLRALPLVYLLLLAMAMGWFGRTWAKGAAPPILLSSFDAMILLILAVGSAF